MTDFAHWLRLDGTTPAWTWLVVGAQTLLVLGLAVAALRRRKRTGDRRDRQETLLLIGGLAFSAVVLGAFAIGTFEGAVAFAADRLTWTDWRKVIPWASLDAASVGFSLFAIRAVMRDRSPRPARRIVYLTATFSAAVQLTQGGAGHHWQAGAFLAFLALIGYKVLDTVVEQLRDAEQDDTVYLKVPAFGLRWFTYLPNTLCAWLAWQNHPPIEGTRPTVLNAVANLDRVRAEKLARLLARPSAPRWAALAPRRYARQLRAAHTEAMATAATLTAELASVQTARADEHTLYAQNLQAMRAELADATAQTQRAYAAQTALETSAQTLRAEFEDRLRTSAQAHRAEGAQAARAEAAQEIDGLRAQLAAARKVPAQPAGSSGSQQAKPQAVTHLRDDDDVADALWDEFCAHMDEKGAPMTRYRVQITAPTNSRQAERVVALLSRRYAEKFGDSPAQGRAQTGAQVSAQTGRADSDDLEDVRAKATG